MHYNRLFFYTTLGSSLEFFDFTIYALFAPYISQVFFPSESASLALMDTFVVFAMGYLARPFGSFIFGHMGDKHGRKNTFSLTVALMSLSTLLIGALPGYNSWGAVSPVLLLLFRLLQGISLGGEVSGSAIFLAEHLEAKRRGSGVAWIFAGVTFGNVLGSTFGVLLSTWLTHAEMLAWGWRIPFLVGSLLGLISYRVRSKALESPVFLEVLRESKARVMPAGLLFKCYLPQIIQGIAITALIAVAIFTLLYLPAFFAESLHMPPVSGYIYSVCNFSLLVISCIAFGYCSNRWGRKALLVTGSALMLLLGYPLFHLVAVFGLSAIWVFSAIFSIMIGMVNACYGCMLIELFPTCIRYSGMSLSYNISFAIFGGFSPLINIWLQRVMGNDFSPFYLLAMAALLTLVASIKAPDMRGRSLNF